MVPSGPAVEKQVPVEPGPDPELRSWRRLVCYLCFYGFMAQIRPGESFITPYLLGPDKNFTPQEAHQEITPVLSYSYLAVLVPVFLLTDYLRYTPVLLLQGLSFVSVWLLLLLGRSVEHMQLMEFFYSVTMAARIAYSSYIFSLVRPARYQRVAGYSRAAVLLGVSKLLIAVVTATQAGLVFLLARTSSIWLCYAAFVLFRGSYQFLVPIATFQIASSLSKELCALVFGVNTFFATVVKTIITFIVSDARGLGLAVREQFQLYCVYFLILSIIYFLGAMLDGLRHCQRGHHRPLPPAQDLRSPVEEKAAQVLSVQDKGLGGLQPAQSLPLSPEDGLGTLGPASLEQRQSDPAPAPALQAAGFLSPVTAPSACTPCSAQASGPDAADETCPQPAVHPPGVSRLGLQRHPSDSVQNVNQ
ncbi:hypothetical protein EGK_13162 [Macaca mulatta]|uniref:Solute carrier family 19 member 1 n=1 Tax=Macaca mulatta TaxID=9544 RepID=G7MMF8_MACMU|nr:hypothetical protein EGK_13162 [Macaca mulatta]